MASEVPCREKQRLESLLYSTIGIQKRIISRSPHQLAVGLGPNSQIPITWVVLAHASNAVQAARYHLYMALHERIYYAKFRKPPDPGSGNVLADFFFTSFSLHAIAAEAHIAVSLARFFNVQDKRSRGVLAPHSRDVYKELQRRRTGRSYRGLLEPFQSGRNSDWTWLRDFRNRWAHMNPVRVKELGIQYSMDFRRKSFWAQDPKSRTASITYSGGDPAEITISEMLDLGVRSFNLLGKQFDSYISQLEADIEKNWQSKLS